MQFKYWNEMYRMIKSGRIRWEGNVALMRENRNAYRVLVGKAIKEKTTRKTYTKLGL
jgi:hypothetical protein